jgi:hypothetical protein
VLATEREMLVAATSLATGHKYSERATGSHVQPVHHKLSPVNTQPRHAALRLPAFPPPSPIGLKPVQHSLRSGLFDLAFKVLALHKIRDLIVVIRVALLLLTALLLLQALVALGEAAQGG